MCVPHAYHHATGKAPGPNPFSCVDYGSAACTSCGIRYCYSGSSPDATCATHTPHWRQPCASISFHQARKQPIQPASAPQLPSNACGTVLDYLIAMSIIGRTNQLGPALPNQVTAPASLVTPPPAPAPAAPVVPPASRCAAQRLARLQERRKHIGSRRPPCARVATRSHSRRTGAAAEARANGGTGRSCPCGCGSLLAVLGLRVWGGLLPAAPAPATDSTLVRPLGQKGILRGSARAFVSVRATSSKATATEM